MTPSGVVVAGALANKPSNGGEAWVRMSWIAGLRRLGFDVLFLEQIARAAVTPEAIAYFERVTADFGLTGARALLDDRGASLAGLSGDDLHDRVAEAALLVNISGNVTLPAVMRRARRTAYIDLDPGFTQTWLVRGVGAAGVAAHDLHFTVGENIGARRCPIPTAGIRWRPLPPPVVLDDWPVTAAAQRDLFTTVATWRSPSGALEHEGIAYPLKHHEWRRVIDLPRRSPYVFEIALQIHPAEEADLAALAEHGWRLRDPAEVAASPDAFRRYVQASGAEFSVANGVYVHTRSGWFSDRTVRYLASGRPVLVQGTGFECRYPMDEGVVGFADVKDAAAGAKLILSDYDRHARAARRLAEERFDSDRVLGAFAEEAEVAP